MKEQGLETEPARMQGGVKSSVNEMVFILTAVGVVHYGE